MGRAAGPPRKVLVTGATGLVGSYLVAGLLSRGDSVRVMARSVEALGKLEWTLGRSGYGLDMVEVADGEVEDYGQVRDATKDCDVVFHCAAAVSMSRDDERLVAANVDMTHHVVAACLESPQNPLLVHVSSIAALGNALPGERLAEDSIFENIAAATPYARSKFLSECEVWKGVSMGLNAVVVNPSVVLGPFPGAGGMQKAINYAAVRGIPACTEGVSGYVDVRDVARAMIGLSLDGRTWGKRYVISGHDLSVRELATMLNGAFGHRAPKLRVGRRTLSVLYGLLRAEQRIFRSKIRVPDFPDLLLGERLYDGALITRSTGFRYSSIENTAAMFRDSVTFAPPSGS